MTIPTALSIEHHIQHRQTPSKLEVVSDVRVGVSIPCLEHALLLILEITHQMFIFLQGKCRQLVCVPGKRIQKDTCLPLLSHSTDLGYTLPLELIVTNVVYGNETSVESMIDHIKRHFEQTLDTLDVKMLEILFIYDMACSKTLNDFDTKNHSLKMFLKMKMKDKKPIDRHVLEINLLNLTESTFEITNGSYSITFLCRESEEGLLLPALYSTYDSSKFCKKKPEINVKSSVFSFLVNKLLFCRHIRLEEKEYTLQGSQLYVPTVNKTFGPFEYFKSDKNVYQICWSDYVSSESSITIMYRILSIFTLVCTILSMLGIVLTLLVFSLLPNTRTLPVKLLMVLLVVLFLTQLLTVIANESTLHGRCLVLGSLLHYLWLCVFMCSLACSCQMYRVFSDDKPARDQNKKETRLFIFYVCTSLLVPLVVVAGNFIYTYVHLPSIEVIYNRKGCTFNDIYGMVGFFISPISAILTVNFCFFARTWCIIQSVPKVEGPNMHIKHSRTYHKLFVITCLSWGLQIVDGLFPISLFSFVAAFINGTQGMFIFVSYVVEKKTLIFLAERFSRHQNEDRTVTSKVI
ncbi:hypothetical protein FSP39_014952 [Pinctada imbricata]|uniref:G-protein coupled receptors family 2 profile 2 domain-containing protein n=1 Tax=Pinctada imbricata TaxID=66713 RepID=A0AA89BYR2_PINIB|nr:hypothetical protein FSP39_014952 [Pinctada imbricata]